ncbi:MAG: response regulator transcription factor [Proteobacteria bacterium]|nr:response regulator transcription factor [Pseudomonadota bacterium]
MRLLIVEDDLKIASFLQKGLCEAGFAVDHATNGEDGLLFFMTQTYDAAVIDIMLPKMDGLSLIEALRKKKINTPVLILSARHSVNDRVTGIQRGGDDYLVKPFAFSELLVRVQALIRRAGGKSEPATLSVGDLTMDLLKRKVYRSGESLDLQPREFALLEYFMRNPGLPLSKTLILEKIWDFSFDPQTNVVDVLVCRLRSKLDKDFPDKLIRTIRGVGYVLEEHR